MRVRWQSLVSAGVAVMMADCLLPGPDTTADDVYYVYALRFAGLERRVRENFILTDLHDGPMPLDYNLWIVRGATRLFLVDTGFGAAAAARRGRLRELDPLVALGQLGIPPGQVSDVVISHLHYDHAGNLDAFTGARLHVQDREAAYATGRCMCEPILRAPFDVEDVVSLVRHTFAERVRFHDGDAQLFPGVSLHLLPGHTAGTQAVRINTPDGPLVLASDVTHFYANMLGRSPIPIVLDVGASLRSYEALWQLAGSRIERIIPGHDPWVRRLYPPRQYAGVWLSALHEAAVPHDINALSLREP